MHPTQVTQTEIDLSASAQAINVAGVLGVSGWSALLIGILSHFGSAVKDAESRALTVESIVMFCTALVGGEAIVAMAKEAKYQAEVRNKSIVIN